MVFDPTNSGSGNAPVNPFALAKELTPTSTTDEIDAVLKAAVQAGLNALDKERFIKLVCAKTGCGKQPLKARYRELEQAQVPTRQSYKQPAIWSPSSAIRSSAIPRCSAISKSGWSV